MIRPARTYLAPLMTSLNAPGFSTPLVSMSRVEEAVNQGEHSLPRGLDTTYAYAPIFVCRALLVYQPPIYQPVYHPQSITSTLHLIYHPSRQSRPLPICRSPSPRLSPPLSMETPLLSPSRPQPSPARPSPLGGGAGRNSSSHTPPRSSASPPTSPPSAPPLPTLQAPETLTQPPPSAFMPPQLAAGFHGACAAILAGEGEMTRFDTVDGDGDHSLRFLCIHSLVSIDRRTNAPPPAPNSIRDLLHSAGQRRCASPPLPRPHSAHTPPRALGPAWSSTRSCHHSHSDASTFVLSVFVASSTGHAEPGTGWACVKHTSDCTAVKKASGIPGRNFHRRPKYSVVVSAGERTWKAKQCRGKVPEWNQTFNLNVDDSVILLVAVIDRVGTRSSSLRGEVTVATNGICNSTGNTFQLQKKVVSPQRLSYLANESRWRELSRSHPKTQLPTYVQAVEPAVSSQEVPAVDKPVSSQGAIAGPPAGLSPSASVEHPAKSGEEVMVAVDEADHSVSGLTTPRVIESVPSITGDVNAIEDVTGSSGSPWSSDTSKKYWWIDTIVQVYPWAALAWSALSVIPKTICAQMNHDQKVQQLGMNAGFEGVAERTLKYSISTAADSAIEQYNAAPKELKEKFKSRSELVALRIFDVIRRGVVELSTLSQDIKRPGCKIFLEQTSLASAAISTASVYQLLARSFFPTSSEKRALWLHGVAGTGKSTVPNTVAARFATAGRRGANFRFSRNVDGRNGPATFKDHILAVVKKYPKMAQFPPQEQLQKYIIGLMTRTVSSGPVVIVINALDECGRRAGPRYEVKYRSLLEPGCLSKSTDGVHGTASDVLNYIAVRILEVANRHRRLSDSLKHEMKAELSLHDVRKKHAALLIVNCPPDPHIRADNQPDTRCGETTQGIEAGLRVGAEEAEVLVDALDVLA
ncbi:hypothetical protein BV22DRAFT_1130549 [Leucogyrophana mollusca]|uniref:Uncharacterized protein n=1 Tax=Leucogyrophana mollusca TaxID=85980 RepID=A0ACB8BGD9_9AGAM|nr:hypothetical protein BV22DRAFT_1130549 [Leucogyrophana mollusca]